MNAKTLEAVQNHGRQLLALFPKATERDPVALCRKLRRVEVALAAPILKNCNEGMDEAELDAITARAVLRVAGLLGMTNQDIIETGLHINRDPRGYALKFSSEWASVRDRRIYRDWGGFGIVAPDLTNER